MRGENEDITWKDDYSKIGRKCLNLLICSCLRACTNTVRNKTPSLVFVVLSVFIKDIRFLYKTLINLVSNIS